MALAIASSLVSAQDDFPDYAGPDTIGNEATNDMLDHDPNNIPYWRQNPEPGNKPNSIMDNLTGRSIALLK